MLYIGNGVGAGSTVLYWHGGISQNADREIEPGRTMSLPRDQSRPQCPVFGVASGVPVIGLGLLIILFGGVLLLTGSSPHATIPPGLMFIVFGAVIIILGIRN